MFCPVRSFPTYGTSLRFLLYEGGESAFECLDYAVAPHLWPRDETYRMKKLNVLEVLALLM
jgi:hypothetical protein